MRRDWKRIEEELGALLLRKEPAVPEERVQSKTDDEVLKDIAEALSGDEKSGPAPK